MSNSPLVDYTQISPNSNNPRNTTIKKITIHHMAGDMTVESCGALFAKSSRQASSNYGIGTDGRVGMYVEEKNRSWCSSSADNDHQSVTIEVANSGGTPDWPVSDKALVKTIDLCVDICQRNNIASLNFTGDVTGNLTQHNYFTATACPGPYLKSKLQYIADEVNKRLGVPLSGDGDDAALTPIMGTAHATAAQMDAYLAAINPNAPLYGNIYIEEGEKEGIRGDIAFAQSCLETGYFKFGNDVKAEQNNFCGLGAVGGGDPGHSFATPREGIRAQIQHMKAYASNETLAGDCIDPRFHLVTRGVAPYVEWLGAKENPQGIGWAVGTGYGEKILTILEKIVATEAEEENGAGLEELAALREEIERLQAENDRLNKYYKGCCCSVDRSGMK